MPKRRHMARGRRAYPASLSFELVEDRSPCGRQPVGVTGHLSFSYFHNGVPKGSPSLLCPLPEPEPNRVVRDDLASSSESPLL